MSLKKQLIKLGAKKKSLQTYIRPLLEEIDRQKQAKLIKTRLFFDPKMGFIEKSRNPEEVDGRDRCPYCMKPLGNGEEVVAMHISSGSEGAHLKCLQREGYRVK